MAHKSSCQYTGSSQVNNDSLDSTFEIKIKTQYFETYCFRVRKNMSISALKWEILIKTGFPVEVQRLLYRGRLLRDNQLMSELNLRNGDTIYLVEMRPVPFQPTFPTVAADASRTSSRQGAGVENSLSSSRIQSGNLANVGLVCQNQASSSTLASVASWPTMNENASFHDALTTISDFIDRMKGEFEVCSNSLNYDQLQMNATPDFSDAGILIPTPVFLSQILDRTEQLLSDSVTTAISHLSRSLRRIDNNPDQVLRGRTQFGAILLGLATQHLGAMLLELGRATMSVVIGQSPGESYVNAGRAAYISSTGLNPILFQQFEQYPYQSWYPYSPVDYSDEQPVPVRSASQVFGSTISKRPPSGSNSAPSLGTQAACIPNVLSCSGNAPVQNSSNATQGFHAVVSSGTQSNMSSSTLQPPGLHNCVLQASQMPLNESLNPEVVHLDSGNDGMSGDSENVGGAEDCNWSGSGENNVADLTVSREVEQQVDLGQAVERSEQICIPRNIFGDALLRAIDQYGECEVYADVFQLGGIQFANEIMEALENYANARLMMSP